MDTVGQNIANVNTEGYSRRRVGLEEMFPRQTAAGLSSMGVEANTARRLRDELLEYEIRRERGSLGQHSARAQALSLLESLIGETEVDGLGRALSDFFDGVSRLSARPEDMAVRLEVVAHAEELTSAFHGIDERLDAARKDADRRIVDTVAEINSLSERIAELNREIVATEAGRVEASGARDERDRLIGELAELVDISVATSEDGALQVSLAGTGDPLVVDARAFPLEARPDGARGGLASVRAERSGVMVDVSDRITGGKLGGLLQLRDVTLTGYGQALDDLAASLITEVNAVHRSGFDLNGNAGGALFEPDPPGTGAAAAIQVSAAILADPGALAASADASPGDNGAALALAALREQPVAALGGSTFAAAHGDLVARMGLDAASAATHRESSGLFLASLESQRDSVAGVSLDEEAADLMRFQRSYEAAARFLRAVDEMTQVVFRTFGA
jgi:flagellar hook-associated protein 1 FlgK